MHPDVEERRGNTIAFSVLECYFEVQEQSPGFRETSHTSQEDTSQPYAPYWESMLAAEAISVLNARLFISMHPAVLTVSSN